MDYFASFFGNIKDKLTNPFFGTLIIVLLIHHWELWYGVFNFQENIPLEVKIATLKDYVKLNITWETFFYDLLFAIGSLLIGYAIVILTRSLVILIEHKIMPNITDKLISDNVVTKEVHNKVVEERDQYFQKYQEQRENVMKFSETVDDQVKQLNEKDQNYTEQSESLNKRESEIHELRVAKEKTQHNHDLVARKLSDLSSEYKTLNDHHKLSMSKLNQYNELLMGKEAKEYFNMYTLPPLVINKYKELLDQDLLRIFLQYGNNNKENFAVLGTANVNKMIKIGVVEKEKDDFFRFTVIGNLIYTYIDKIELHFNN